MAEEFCTLPPEEQELPPEFVPHPVEDGQTNPETEEEHSKSSLSLKKRLKKYTVYGAAVLGGTVGLTAGYLSGASTGETILNGIAAESSSQEPASEEESTDDSSGTETDELIEDILTSEQEIPLEGITVYI